MPSGRHPRQTALPTGFGFGPPRTRASRPTVRPGALATPAKHPLTIGEVAKRFGVTLRTLRFYEQKGLLAPTRRGQERLYGADQIDVLARIVEAKALGLTLREVEGLLAGQASEDLPPAAVAAQIAHLERQRDEIDAALARLRAMLPPDAGTDAKSG